MRARTWPDLVLEYRPSVPGQDSGACSALVQVSRITSVGISFPGMTIAFYMAGQLYSTHIDIIILIIDQHQHPPLHSLQAICKFAIIDAREGCALKDG